MGRCRNTGLLVILKTMGYFPAVSSLRTFRNEILQTKSAVRASKRNDLISVSPKVVEPESVKTKSQLKGVYAPRCKYKKRKVILSAAGIERPVITLMLRETGQLLYSG